METRRVDDVPVVLFIAGEFTDAVYKALDDDHHRDHGRDDHCDHGTEILCCSFVFIYFLLFRSRHLRGKRRGPDEDLVSLSR